MPMTKPDEESGAGWIAGQIAGAGCSRAPAGGTVRLSGRFCCAGRTSSSCTTGVWRGGLRGVVRDLRCVVRGPPDRCLANAHPHSLRPTLQVRHRPLEHSRVVHDPAPIEQHAAGACIERHSRHPESARRSGSSVRIMMSTSLPMRSADRAYEPTSATARTLRSPAAQRPMSSITARAALRLPSSLALTLTVLPVRRRGRPVHPGRAQEKRMA
jgi:hypothetical protein